MSFGNPPSFEGHRLIKVNIDKPTAAGDGSGYGSPSTAWTSFAVGVPAALENVTGREQYADQAIQGITRFQLLIRYLKGITEKMRVTFTNDGVQFLCDIENVDNWRFANRWMTLHCKSGVNRG